MDGLTVKQSVEPLFPDFTMIKVLDKNNNVVSSGAYIHMCDNHQCVGPLNINDYHHCIISKGLADWGMPDFIVFYNIPDGLTAVKL